MSVRGGSPFADAREGLGKRRPVALCPAQRCLHFQFVHDFLIKLAFFVEAALVVVVRLTLLYDKLLNIGRNPGHFCLIVLVQRIVDAPLGWLRLWHRRRLHFFFNLLLLLLLRRLIVLICYIDYLRTKLLFDLVFVVVDVVLDHYCARLRLLLLLYQLHCLLDLFHI